METIYLGIVIFLFSLACFDLMVGVSNDAVNFLNSAVGSKAATFKVILIVASIGVLIGASTSNGMMDIARHGIFQPQHFYFSEIMIILVSVTLTDVVLLDIFNSMGLPTSTTVSMVFELLGGTFAISLIKSYHTSYTLGELINTDKALSVILGIFLSIAIAFFFGLIVQWLARVIFSFSYKKNLKYTIGLFGGVATSAILYFVLIKGLHKSAFMTPVLESWISNNTFAIVTIIFITATLLMQFLHLLKVNVFKIVVLMGTFALALAFAGNDLVNFIGVPLAGYSSYMDFISYNGSVSPDGLLMTSLLGRADTPWYFLVGAAVIMVIALSTSRKAHNVIKTSVNLARQEEGEENFGSTPMARTLVRMGIGVANALNVITPNRLKVAINTRFRKNEAILEDGAAFDLVRASVNLVLAGLLIIFGTSLKLPLSTTYVTFMVAMGSSLADRAWGRDSAVFRITGVLSVIGGWFITAGAAFIISFTVATTIYFLGLWALIVFILIAVGSLIRSSIIYRNRKNKETEGEIVTRLLACQEEEQQLALLREYTRDELSKTLNRSADIFETTSYGFLNENLRKLRKSFGSAKFQKRLLNQMKRMGTVAVSRLNSTAILEKGLYYYQGNDFAGEIVYSCIRLCEPCVEHIDNNFNPLNDEQREEFADISKGVVDFMKQAQNIIKNNDYTLQTEVIGLANNLNTQLAHIKRKELKRIQEQHASIKVSMVYLTMIQETQNLVTYTSHILKVSRKFQLD